MRAVARALAYAFVGFVVVCVAYAAFFVAYDPREPALPPLRLTRAAATPGVATLLFAGDTAEAWDALPIIRERGLLYPFTSTMDLVRSADLAIVNNEAAISDGGTRFPAYKDWYYRAPAASAAALAEAGFDVVNLANNHAVDYSADGLVDTIANLERAQLLPLGAGRNAAEARRGIVADLGGLRVGLLAYCDHDFLWNVWVDQFAHRHHPGTAALLRRSLVEDIARLRAVSDVVIVSLHLGDNYAPPTADTIAWSRRAIDAGADLVVDHHPHVAHPLMMWHNRPIVLSLGNYAFGTLARDSLDYGQLAWVEVRRCGNGTAALTAVEIVPLAVQNRRVSYRPEPLGGRERDGYLEQLRRDSAAFGATLELVDGRARLGLRGCS